MGHSGGHEAYGHIDGGDGSSNPAVVVVAGGGAHVGHSGGHAAYGHIDGGCGSSTPAVVVVAGPHMCVRGPPAAADLEGGGVVGRVGREGGLDGT